MKVLVVDDHQMIRAGIRVLLRNTEFRVIGEASEGYQAIDLVGQLRPDLVLMDLNMPGMGGLAATRQIRRQYPSAMVVILTASEREEDLFGALRAGAHGYLLKSIGAGELINALRSAALGETPIAPALRSLVIERIRQSEPLPADDSENEEDQRLSLREMEVLNQISLGLTYKEVAAELHVAENTVKSHMRRILTKLGLRNRSEAVRYTMQNAGESRPGAMARQYESVQIQRVGGE